ncbi:hypothetical protein JTB14_029530 [Gonioctena quinquepunctata]|nr:hypothetical protein JTB14_029530 [Gonioctena quinquepunctata]
MEKLKTQVHGIHSDLKVASDFVCKSCALGKSRRLPFVKTISGSTGILDLVYSDIAGPYPSSLSGSKYVITFLDDFSHKILVFFLSKDQADSCFVDFEAYVENQTGKKNRILRTDTGGEYCSLKMQDALTSKANRLFDVEKHAVFTSRDIIFPETEKGSSLLKKTDDTSRNAIFFPDSSETDDIFTENDSSDATCDFSPVDSESADSSIVTRYEGASDDSLGFPDSAKSEADDASSAVESDSDYIPPETVDVENENLRRETHDERPPIHLQDYDLNFVLTVLSDDPVTVDDAVSRPEKEE